MAGTIIYCRLCSAAYGSAGEVPTQCPTCHRDTKWSTSAPARRDGAGGLVLTVTDRRWLRSQRIDPDG